MQSMVFCSCIHLHRCMKLLVQHGLVEVASIVGLVQMGLVVGVANIVGLVQMELVVVVASIVVEVPGKLQKNLAIEIMHALLMERIESI